MRWLLIKDLQILQALAAAGRAAGRLPDRDRADDRVRALEPAGKPKVALLRARCRRAKARSASATSRSTSRSYANAAVPVDRRRSRSARAPRRSPRSSNGHALAALIIPADIVGQINSLITQGVGSPTVELILNTEDPLERQFAAARRSTSRASQVEQAVSKQVLRVAVDRPAAGAERRHPPVPRPERAAARPAQLAHDRPGDDRARCRRTRRCAPRCARSVNFANLAIDGLDFATPVLELDRQPADREADQARPARPRLPTPTRSRSR